MMIAMAVALAPSAAAAQEADDFCAGLRRIVAAARESTPFASVDAPEPNRLLGFATFCWRVQMGGVRFSCIADRPPAAVTQDAVVADVMRCYPNAQPDPEPDPEDPQSKDTRLLVAGLKLLVMSREYADGRTVSLVVWPPRD